MKKLLNTLYVLSPDSYLGLELETVCVQNTDKPPVRVPLLNLEGIVSCGWRGASPALMGECAKRGIALVFLSGSGRLLARVSGESRGNVTLRREQYRLADSDSGSCAFARSFIAGKLYNARWMLERATRDHPLRVDVDALKRAAAMLAASAREAAACENLERLRGVEGQAAAVYFEAFDQLILQQREAFRFEGRSRRPPLDRVNALLSFAYSLLAHEYQSALESVGLDAYVGFLHRDRPGRASLALDMMEELRGVLADRFVLSLINKRELTATDFDMRENGAVQLTDDGRRRFFSAWQERKKEELTHPYLEEKLPWGLVPHVQAQLLARTIRGDLDAYPPFLWK